MEKYNHQKIEAKWQKKWNKEKLYKTSGNKDKPKYYVLDMFPYPSGSGLHVGHPKGYIATDIFARAKMMQGYNVLHPMGWDAFGLPTENYAMQNKIHPCAATEKNIATFKRQLGLLGFTYDWDREINTTDPEYYKWTQWTFLKMFERGLAYESYEPINWCPKCQTGLSNEDLEDGKCERCDSVVEKKPMRQWLLKITDYADRLLSDLEKLPAWEESIKEMQRNWIGRKEGINIDYKIEGLDSKLSVFTTRPDTNFGATFIVAAPDSVFTAEKIGSFPNQAEVKKYVEAARHKTELERISEGRKKTGVFTGLNAINNLTGRKMPIYISDFILASVGTGVVVGVPGHDLRDFEFAQAMGLEIIRVVVGADGDTSPITKKEQVQEEAGTMINSGLLDGMNIHDATRKIMDHIETKDWGKKIVSYKIKDWVFSRQRYWGEPIPIIHCQACKNKKYNFIFIHGYGSSGKEGWRPWLKRELEGRGHKAYSPDLPNSLKPNVDEQADFIIKNVELGEDTILIGGSLGGVVIMRILEKIKIKIAKAVFIDSVFKPEFADHDRPDVAAACDWKFNIKKISQASSSFVVLADSDFPVIKKEHSEELAKKFNTSVTYVKPNGQHFSKSATEPEILKIFGNLGIVIVPYEDLPLKLPEVKNYQPTGTGESPLANIKEWVNTKCPQCGGRALRETNTMPQWAGSSWYYLRYIDPKNKTALVDKDKEKYWSPVDFYVGGAEHATRHLIYARFWHKFLFDIGAVNYDEPFTRLQHVGLILAEDGRKMSKRWNNVINPDEIVEKYGADAMRIYEMFMGPFSQPCAWSTKSLIGGRRFLEKIWHFYHQVKLFDCGGVGCDKAPTGLPQLMHKTIKKVTEDIENFHYNTAISQMMIFMNFASQLDSVPRGALENFLKILAPFAPHLTEELWSGLGHPSAKLGTSKQSIFKEEWPKYNPELVKDETINLVIQINGKVRDTVEVFADISEKEAREFALDSEKIKKWLDGKEIKKVIFVKGKLVNVVI